MRGAAPIDFDRWLGLAGLRVVVSHRPALDREGRPRVELRAWAWQPPAGGPLRMAVANPASAFARAGLHSGDELVSIDDRPMATWPEMRAVLAAARIGDPCASREAAGGIVRATIVMSGYDEPVVRVEEIPEATARQRAVREGWLRAAVDGGGRPAR